ncbi:protein kinase [Sphaerisporangium sp. TRM90804]|uniref:protein kinase domain-containing protein n=1 Tax=Sphaerisporangium sp. TRM90804 TaxID=3031113 RepID=UPI0024480FEB|nr:protein kinase [Sphaerisporangium sp. TRM90804]MDH2428227.1 protein kinase [Sphaerisporangium sp. TRM90804]
MADIAPLRTGDPPRVGDYEIAGRVGEGGQGSVFLGTSPTGEQVAIKLLRHGLGQAGSGPPTFAPSAPPTDGTFAPERFLRETQILRRVAPFCTAQVIGTGTMDGRPYIVSEYIAGPTLQQVVDEEGPLHGARLRRLAVGTMTALTAIHRAGVVHRDFKPSNVLLGRDGPRVIDFGIARALDASATGSGVIGTPPYMAPEQIEGAQVEPPADLFAWGSTMAFAATGRPPFGMDSLPAVVNRILHKEPELGDLDGDLRDLITDCLSKEPALRPTARDALLRLLGATREQAPAGELLSAGTAVAAGSPATTRPPLPPSPPDAATSPSPAPRRRRVATQVAAGAVVVGLVSGGLVYLLARLGPPATVAGRSATAAPSPIREVTAAPSPVATTFLLPSTKVKVHDAPSDPVRLTSFMHNADGQSLTYARDPKTGRFEEMGPFQEPVVSPDGRWVAILPWLKSMTPQSYDFVRLLERSTGREFNVRLADKPLENFNPFWSSDSKRLLLTTLETVGSAKRPIGFAVVDVATATAKLVPVPNAAGGRRTYFVWGPGETGVAISHFDGDETGLRFLDLQGKIVRTFTDVGDITAAESSVSPAGRLFATRCADAINRMCVWDSSTGRRTTSLPVPYPGSFVGWFNDAHLIVTDNRGTTRTIKLVDLKGKVLRTLAEVPLSETNGKDGRLLYRYTRG